MLLDPLASWRRRRLVLDISFSGAQAALRPNRRGELWVLGRLPPGSAPPPLELRFRALRQAELAWYGPALGSQPLRLPLSGQVVVVPPERRLDGRVRIWSSGQPGSALLVGGGDWQERRWGVELAAQGFPLQPLQRFLPRRVRLAGHADGRWRLTLDQGRFRCDGTLQLGGVQWRQPGLEGPIIADRLPLRCAPDRLSIASSGWRYGPWGGQVAAQIRQDRSLLVRLSARPPAALRLPPGALQAVLQGRWR